MDILEGGVNGGDVGVQGFLAGGAGFHQQGADLIVQGFQPFRQAGRTFHRAQGGAVHKLGGGNGQTSHGRGQVTGGLDRGQEQQGRGLEGGFLHGAVGHFGDEAQGAFGTYHDMLQNFKGVVKIHQGVEAVACGVFDLEFAADALGQGRVGQDFFAQGGQARKDVSVAAGKGRAAFGVRRIQQRAVGQDHAGGKHGFIGVVRRAAAHAAGVVGKNAADEAAVDGGRVRPDFFAEFRQDPVGSRADDARLQGNALGVCAHPPVAPALADAHQHGIRHGLAGKAGARRAEGHGHQQAVRQTQYLHDFSLVQHIHHQLGREAVDAGVRAVGQQAQGVGIDAFLGDKS